MELNTLTIDLSTALNLLQENQWEIRPINHIIEDIQKCKKIFVAKISRYHLYLFKTTQNYNQHYYSEITMLESEFYLSLGSQPPYPSITQSIETTILSKPLFKIINHILSMPKISMLHYDDYKVFLRINDNLEFIVKNYELPIIAFLKHPLGQIHLPLDDPKQAIALINQFAQAPRT